MTPGDVRADLGALEQLWREKLAASRIPVNQDAAQVEDGRGQWS